MNEEMHLFYQNRIEHLESMLERSMEMNRRLVELLGTRDDTKYIPRTTPYKDEFAPPWKVTCDNSKSER
jgi:hypothetical protein